MEGPLESIGPDEVLVVNDLPPDPQQNTPDGIVGSDGRLLPVGDGEEGTLFIGAPLPTGGQNGAGELLASLRIRGEDEGTTTHFALGIAEVQVRANGNLLATVLPQESGLDLAQTDHAWLLGAFEIPGDAASVDFLVRFADSSSLQNAGGSVTVDSRNAPLRFTASRAQLAARGHAVIHVRINQSLLETEAGTQFLPQVQIRY